MTDQSLPRPPGFWAKLGAGVTRLRNFTFNSVFLVLLIALASGLVSNCQQITVPQGSALLINLEGVLVERASLPDPLTEFLSPRQRTRQVELHAVVRAIEHAALDTDINMILLDLDDLAYASPAHAQRIGQALLSFRDAGKRVVAYGLYYSQAQYHIASFADALYMHPMGQLVFEGFGGFGFYFSDFLQKFDINVHVYRVGEYKSAVEPLLRNDMSEESRMDSEMLYQNIWQHVIGDIADNRMLKTADIQEYADNLGEKLEAAQGDMARAALEANLVDELLTSDQANVRIAEQVGYRNNGSIDLNTIDLDSYLTARNLRQFNAQPDADQIAVIVAQGMILSSGTGDDVVAADATIELIRQARRDPAIKALVLRVDSPGGSQFASELIRQELELLQIAGKPVVASFGPSAASGGYWISATADHIVAEPTTITGSIGVFSFFTTFENTLANYGVYTDGVGTTTNAGDGLFTGVSEATGRILQASVNNGYEQFVNLVARGRGLSLAAVSNAAEGRVWTGEVAKDLGLVDELGGLQLAIDTAAELAGVQQWSTLELRRPIDPRAAIMAQLLNPEANQTNGLGGIQGRLMQLLSQMQKFDDPNHIYALCESCWRASL